MTVGIVQDAGERLRGVVCPSCDGYLGCGGRFGGASGNGFGGRISQILGRCFNGHLGDNRFF